SIVISEVRDQPRQDELVERGIELRPHPQRVKTGTEASAFYPTLLGHQYRVALRDSRVPRHEPRVIRKRVRRRVEPEHGERSKEPRRVADPGHGVKAFA